MPLTISRNIASEVVQKNLEKASKSTEDHLEKLSTGKRINKPSDDAAGLAIAERLNAQVKGLRQAERNANDGISLIQTAEGGLGEVSNLLTRMRELTIQSASDTIGKNERQYLQKEYVELMSEIDRISESTTFNGSKLLDGKGSGRLDFQVGTFSGEHNRISFDTSKTDLRSSSIGIDSTNVLEKDDALDSIKKIDDAFDTVNGYRASLGSLQSRLNSSVNTIGSQILNQEKAKSTIEDADVAKVVADLTTSNVLKNVGIASLAQANSLPNSILKLI